MWMYVRKKQTCRVGLELECERGSYGENNLHVKITPHQPPFGARSCTAARIGTRLLTCSSMAEQFNGVH